MVLLWDGEIWGLATAKRRRACAVIAAALVVAATVGGAVAYADILFPCTCPSWAPQWACEVIWLCGT